MRMTPKQRRRALHKANRQAAKTRKAGTQAAEPAEDEATPGEIARARTEANKALMLMAGRQNGKSRKK